MQPVTKPSGRRALASFLTLVFLGFYIWAAIAIGERLPDHWLAHLTFYGLAGILWGVPLLPLYSWAERGSRKP